VSSDEQTDTGKERRRFPRLSTACAIRVRPLSGVNLTGDGIEGVTVNISGGGLCYRSDVAVELGAFLAVELRLPDFPSPVLALARAASCTSAGALYEVGLEFWWVGWGDDSAQRAISDFIKTELRQEGDA
jgi:hypothetical protein